MFVTHHSDFLGQIVEHGVDIVKDTLDFLVAMSNESLMLELLCRLQVELLIGDGLQFRQLAQPFGFVGCHLQAFHLRQLRQVGVDGHCMVEFLLHVSFDFVVQLVLRCVCVLVVKDIVEYLALDVRVVWVHSRIAQGKGKTVLI